MLELSGRIPEKIGREKKGRKTNVWKARESGRSGEGGAVMGGAYF